MKKRQNQRGNSLIEFALSATLLVLIFSGAFQFGYACLAYNQIEAAVRSGARYASTIRYDSATSAPSATFANAVKNVVVFGTATPSAGQAPVVPGLSTGHVVVTPIFVGNVPGSVRVAISGYPLNTIWRTYTLMNKPYAVFPFLGVYAPA
ncbi:MAG TPA: TadE family protein [Bryobacteraceae bacterium]|nr:TadE family protein [Bryobacteraceae bacterium]